MAKTQTITEVVAADPEPHSLTGPAAPPVTRQTLTMDAAQSLTEDVYKYPKAGTGRNVLNFLVTPLGIKTAGMTRAAIVEGAPDPTEALRWFFKARQIGRPTKYNMSVKQIIG